MWWWWWWWLCIVITTLCTVNRSRATSPTDHSVFSHSVWIIYLVNLIRLVIIWSTLFCMASFAFFSTGKCMYVFMWQFVRLEVGLLWMMDSDRLKLMQLMNQSINQSIKCWNSKITPSVILSRFVWFHHASVILPLLEPKAHRWMSNQLKAAVLNRCIYSSLKLVKDVY